MTIKEENETVAMPAWTRTFARTGKLPPESERQSNDPGGTPDDAAERDAAMVYARAWRNTVREMTRLKADAARVTIAFRHDTASAMYRAAAQRGFDIDEEWVRLRKARDKRAPLVLRAFPPLDGTAAGRSIEAAERDAARNPLFADRKAAASGMDDVDAFGGVSL